MVLFVETSDFEENQKIKAPAMSKSRIAAIAD
jgi:hypothetical protein